MSVFFLWVFLPSSPLVLWPRWRCCYLPRPWCCNLIVGVVDFRLVPPQIACQSSFYRCFSFPCPHCCELCGGIANLGHAFCWCFTFVMLFLIMTFLLNGIVTFMSLSLVCSSMHSMLVFFPLVLLPSSPLLLHIGWWHCWSQSCSFLVVFLPSCYYSLSCFIMRNMSVFFMLMLFVV